jgi:hypothetical protein
MENLRVRGEKEGKAVRTGEGFGVKEVMYSCYTQRRIGLAVIPNSVLRVEAFD